MTRYRPKNLPPLECTHTQIFDILGFAASLNERFTSNDIAFMFRITQNDACVRLNKLRRWGMIKVCHRSRPMIYLITDWGKRFLADREKKKEADEVMLF